METSVYLVGDPEYRLARVTVISKECLTLCDYVTSGLIESWQAALEYVRPILQPLEGTENETVLLFRVRFYSDCNLVMPIRDRINEFRFVGNVPVYVDLNPGKAPTEQ